MRHEGTIKALLATLLLTATYAGAEPCLRQAQDAREWLVQNPDWPRVNFQLDTDELCAQAAAFAAKVDFPSALKAAIESWMTDDTDVESPLALASQQARDELGWDAEDTVVRNRAGEILRQALANPKSSLCLVARDDRSSSCWRPEYREPRDRFWVFHLQLPSLSDHLFWAIVDQNEVEPTYNYGFN